MTRISQKNRIKNINKKLLLMSDLAQHQIRDSMEVLKSRDVERAKLVIENDDAIDKLQQEIEEACVIFIATEQPLAKDLRNIFATTKVVTDLERMADHAVDICNMVKNRKITSGEFLEESLPLWGMESKVRDMIAGAIKAFIERDIDKAIELYKRDEEINLLYGKILDDITNAIKRDGKRTEKTAQLLFVARYLERIGDRVTNICESIVFAKKGEYIDFNQV